MGTKFFIEIDGRSEFAAELSRTDEAGEPVNPMPTVDNFILKWSKSRQRWYFEVYGIVTEPTPDLVTLIASRTDITIVEVEIVKGAATVDRKSAYRGVYVGGNRFVGCRGTVDSWVSEKTGSLQSITVFGPVATCGLYYDGITQCRIRPTIWREPKPGWPRRLAQFLRLISQ
ncbi:hypothetical protein IPG36_06400 [bacterium]|nr:MAG: hypothetical protein IPG36_06400 [bacterium]